MTSRRPCRRSRSRPPSGGPDERHGLRQRAGAACLSRRDAARGQGRPDLQARSRCSTSISPKRRAPTSSSDTVSYDTVVKTASEAFCDAPLPAGRSRGRRGRRRGPRRVSAGAHDPRHRAQAACADRGDLRRCRRRSSSARARQTAKMAEAFIALGGNVGDVRVKLRSRDRACCATAATVRLMARSSRLSHAAVGRRPTSRLSSTLHRGRDHA